MRKWSSAFGAGRKSDGFVKNSGINLVIRVARALSNLSKLFHGVNANILVIEVGSKSHNEVEGWQGSARAQAEMTALIRKAASGTGSDGTRAACSRAQSQTNYCSPSTGCKDYWSSFLFEVEGPLYRTKYLSRQQTKASFQFCGLCSSLGKDQTLNRQPETPSQDQTMPNPKSQKGNPAFEKLPLQKLYLQAAG